VVLDHQEALRLDPHLHLTEVDRLRAEIDLKARALANAGEVLLVPAETGNFVVRDGDLSDDERAVARLHDEGGLGRNEA